MMESPPASPLEVSEAELALQFLIVAFDAPAQLDDVDENRERRVLRQGREPVLGRLPLALRPLNNQPFDRMGLDEFAIARGRPDPQGGEARRQSLVGAFAPLDGLPGLGGQASVGRRIARSSAETGRCSASCRNREGLRPRPLQGLGGRGSSPGGQSVSVDCTPAA
jgi:hypothetical protein